MTKRRKKKRSAMSVADALKVVDDDLPDGAWMAMLEELTGLDAGDVSAELAKIAQQQAKEASRDDAFPKALAEATQHKAVGEKGNP